MVTSKSAEADAEIELKHFRKQVVGLDKKVSLWDGSSKKCVNTENVVLTLSGKCCILS